MKNTDKLISNWKDVEFESSSGKTEQFKKFAREFKAAIKEQTKDDFEVASYNVGHFEISGFLKSKTDDSKFIYFGISDVRSFYNQWMSKILIRTANNLKDFSGGHNNYNDLVSLGERVKYM